MKNQERLQIEYVKVSDLIPYDKNPRKNDPAVDAVAASIKNFGFKIPIVIDEQGVLVCGHTRTKAAKKLGIEEVPCIRATDLTPEQIRAFRIADNKVAELAEWDDALLGEEIAALPEFNFEEFGFDLDEITPEGEVDTKEDEFDVDAEPEVINVKMGEVWKCGEHRLMIGDSTKEEDVKRLMGNDQADLVITDPPYNVAYEGKDGMTIKNDDMEDSQFRAFLKAAFKNMEDAMKPGASAYIWHADSEGYNFRGACHDVGLTVRQCLIWKKNALVLGRQDYQWIHEPCIYLWKEGASHNWYADRSQTTVMDFEKPRKSDLHPTMKPLALFAYQMQNSSKPGDVVLDLFGGSGTTMICAERAGRRARLMEFDPTYAQRIINRWEEESGKKAEKVIEADGTPVEIDDDEGEESPENAE